MSNFSIAEGIRHAIYSHTYDIFELMDFNYKVDDIVVDFCNANSDYLEATFYIKTVENVNRKMWYESVDFIFQDRKDIRLDLLKKKADQNIHFHLKYTKKPDIMPIYEQKVNPLRKKRL